VPLFRRLFASAERAESPLPYPHDSPEGLAARWVRWAASAPRAKNPIADKTGKHSAINQPEDVFFLAGTFGGLAHRRCIVPAGTLVFFPVMNMWRWPASGPPPRLPQAYGQLTVDGEPTKLETIETPEPFEVTGAELNPVTRASTPIPVTIWGLWGRLDSLSPGDHLVQFEGGDGHGFTVGATYEITVV
jgi:hypothetical protein